MKRIFSACLLLSLSAAACKDSGSSTPPPDATAAPGEPAPSSERASLTTEECTAQGGQVVGDIGDGATQRPDYVCPSGKPPFGNIAPAEGEPVAIEGSVCCPA